MTPADFTPELLQSWGGNDCFNAALSLAKQNAVAEARWDDVDHVISGKISRPDGWGMPVSLEVLDDGTIIPHCPCRTCAEYGQVCSHVVALGLHQMVNFAPESSYAAGEEPRGANSGAPRSAAAASGEGDEASVAEALRRFVPAPVRVHAKLSGSRASLSIQITAHYGDMVFRCGEIGAVDEVISQDQNDRYLFRVRNVAAEAAALRLVKDYGFEEGYRAETKDRLFLSDPHGVLNFLGAGLPCLRRSGWRVELAPKLEALLDDMPMIVPVVKVRDAPRNAFDVQCSFEVCGRDLSPAYVQGAINRGDSFVMDEGKVLLLDVEAVESMRAVFTDCARGQNGAPPGFFRVGGVYAPFVRAALESLDAVDLDDDEAPNWRETASARNRDATAKFEPVPLGPLDVVLRPYQKQGVYWMRFLEKSGLSGLLADEMGLGKTLQTLAWISLERCDPEARGKPALIVCPTSLVRNWDAEAEKFTPHLRRLVVSGPNRSEHFGEMDSADIVITSYALLQRDLDEAYRERTFSVVVLDEAQHIKNRTTRNARAAKGLVCTQKLVLTGTPVENSVADVWSIFDFLLPDYLGDYEMFKVLMEQPIADGGRAGAVAQEKLRHMLHPFILRRLKKDVAKDLPDKILKVAWAPLTPEQQRIEAEVRQSARGAKTKFEMLAALMRLRQAANHPALVEKNGDYTEEDSGKMDVFFELLDEAMDGGHRVLVFSQFVSMLTILRKSIEARNIPYCYLDGSTKDRIGECRRFNQDESIPVFLISLHAGGTGLNLTGADMVVLFDPWWNPAVENQAIDRAHRIGQKRTVQVVKMISENSVEERVLALQQKKQMVIDATVDATDEAVLSKMSFDDLRAIAGL